MSTEISMTTGRIDDPADMARFLEPIPGAAQLAKVLLAGSKVSSRAFDDEAFTARFVASDGGVVQCFTVRNITIDQAEMIAAASLDRYAIDELEFREIVALALGPTFDSDD